MNTMEFWLFGIFLMLAFGGVVAFAYLVIKPSQVRWAVRTARTIVASGRIESRWRFENVFRILATAGNDREAAYLWQRLLEIREKAE